MLTEAVFSVLENVTHVITFVQLLCNALQIKLNAKLTPKLQMPCKHMLSNNNVQREHQLDAHLLENVSKMYFSVQFSQLSHIKHILGT